MIRPAHSSPRSTHQRPERPVPHFVDIDPAFNDSGEVPVVVVGQGEYAHQPEWKPRYWIDLLVGLGIVIVMCVFIGWLLGRM